MRIAFLGNFRVDYTSETHHAKTLREMGHEVIPLQETEVTGEMVLEAAKNSELFVWIHTHGWKTGGMPMDQVLYELKRLNIPSMTYHLDLWFGLRRQADIHNDPYWHVQHFFTADRCMADWLNAETDIKGHYMPAGVYRKECHLIPDMDMKNEVIFVGSRKYHREWQYRSQLVDWLSDTYKNRFRHFGNDGEKVIRGMDLTLLYNSTKVTVGDSLCLNFNYPDYWSDRAYETLGRGGFLIHPYIAGMERHFADMQHLVFYDYGNFKQLESLINYYLEHDEEREEIRRAGHEHVKNNHTYTHRWGQILQELGL